MRWVFSLLLLAAVTQAAPDEDKIDLHVLYAGVKEHARTAEFTGFLGETFARVSAIELATLSMETARDADVVVVDSPSPYGEGREFNMPKVPRLDLSFTKPVVLMGAAGGAVLGPLRIKLNWL